MSMMRRRWRCSAASFCSVRPQRAAIQLRALPHFSKSSSQQTAASAVSSRVGTPSHHLARPRGKARVWRRLQLLLLAGCLLAGEAVGLAAQFNGNLSVFIIVALLQGAVWAIAAA